MSLPWLIGAMPAAAAEAAPPLEPPAVRSAFQGFRVAPCNSFSVIQRIEKHGALVRPTTIAPALRKLATVGLSSPATRSLNAATALSVGQSGRASCRERVCQYV